MGFVTSIVAGRAIKKTLAPYVQKSQAPAQAAAPVAAPDVKQETGVDTTGETLKRKARGKKGLMINPTNTTGGGLAGGTGLNI